MFSKLDGHGGFANGRGAHYDDQFLNVLQVCKVRQNRASKEIPAP